MTQGQQMKQHHLPQQRLLQHLIIPLLPLALPSTCPLPQLKVDTLTANGVAQLATAAFPVDISSCRCCPWPCQAHARPPTPLSTPCLQTKQYCLPQQRSHLNAGQHRYHPFTLPSANSCRRISPRMPTIASHLQVKQRCLP